MIKNDFSFNSYNFKYQIMSEPDNPKDQPNPSPPPKQQQPTAEITTQISQPVPQPQIQVSPQKSDSTDKNKQEEKQVKEVEELVEKMNLEEAKKDEKEDQEEVSQPEQKSVKQSQNENELLDDTKFFVEISKPNIPFGKNVLFPGSIQEIDVSIGLKDESMYQSESNDPFMLRVIAKCSNPEFDALDQYVFSVRSNDRFQYFQEVRFKIRKKERANVKVAVKIPPVKENYMITGVLEIQLEGLKPVHLPITAKCQVPQILCMKDLYKSDEDCSMIKVPAKKNQIRMPPIPFKNLSTFNFTLQVQAISNQNFANRAYDIISQNYVNCQANMQFFVNLQLKQNINYKGIIPVKDTIRKILVLKIKNSSIYFNYPLEINIYESTNSSGMS